MINKIKTDGKNTIVENVDIDPTYIFLEAPLYKKCSNAISSKIENFSSTLDVYCVICKQDSVFKRVGLTPHQSMARITSPGISGARIPYVKTPEFSRIFSIEFTCSRNEKHEIAFIFREDGHSFSKIGEYPSLSDRKYPGIRKYEKDLGSYLEEFKKALNLHYHNVGIGSFVYLRRVLEKVVYDVAVRKYSNQPDWNLEKWRQSKNRFEDVINDLSNELPEFLVKNTILYTILSKGIHDLNEEECKNYFEVVQDAVEEILDDKLTRDEKEKRRNSVSKKLSQIISGLKTKGQ